MEAHDDCKKELFAVCTKTNYATLIKNLNLIKLTLSKTVLIDKFHFVNFKTFNVTIVLVLNNPCRHDRIVEEIGFYIFQTEQLIFLCLLFLFILVCNVTVLILIFMTRKRRSRMNIFIANLALAGIILPRFQNLFSLEISPSVNTHCFSNLKCFWF